jgi:NADPH2:quinone reductase
MKTIVMNHPGGTEVLEVVDRPDPVPRPGQALVEVAAAGVNFMDMGCGVASSGPKCRCLGAWE